MLISLPNCPLFEFSEITPFPPVGTVPASEIDSAGESMNCTSVILLRLFFIW